MSSISHSNTDLAKNIQTQSENIAIQAKLSLRDLEEQMDYNEEISRRFLCKCHGI